MSREFTRKEGESLIVMLNLCPLGCIPTINLQKGVTNGSCMEEVTNMVKIFNSALPEMLKKLEKQLPGFKFYDIRGGLLSCGTGPFRGIHSCGGKKQKKVIFAPVRPESNCF
ncbi:hypothetical protein H5410_034802 [Solanum commersonii]|uniref:Uncharacterized protein n=1 Tax=Solanum commersonii TaxID=4109 RepID=A0A9J5YUI3_SOLCO|nr:hypothetical protein H5410_034802 [Solanum commersonii]